MELVGIVKISDVKLVLGRGPQLGGGGMGVLSIVKNH